MADHARLGVMMFVTGALLVLVPIGIGLLVIRVVLRARREQREGGDRGHD